MIMTTRSLLRSLPQRGAHWLWQLLGRLARRFVYRPLRCVILRASPTLALLETLLLAAIFLMSLKPQNAVGSFDDLLPSLGSTLAVSSSCALWFAVRLRLPRGRRLGNFMYEVGAIGLFTVLLMGLLAIFLVALGNQQALEAEFGADRKVIGSVAIGSLAALTILLFAVYRIGLRMVRTLERLRRQHLRWALTHGHITVLTGFIGAIALITMMVSWAAVDEMMPGQTGATPLALRLLYGIMLPLSLFAAEMVVTLMVVVPPIAFLSFLLTRRMTRRLEQLVAATQAISHGDYSARVTSTGQDEISQLQRHFNQMAVALQQAMHELAEKQQHLEAAQLKSETLLLNVLPPMIAERLKANEQNIADHFAEATVLFGDIVNFTALSSTLPPGELVAWLNQVFSAFDFLAEKYGLEKIKTIGDAYMVVGGLPNPRADHALAVAQMAVEMQRELSKYRAPNGEALKMRIGIHTGQVVAGVIGTKKFIYDLWGDTVNTASRMESHGVGGAIQVTAATYTHLRNHYDFVERGLIDIKGKGPMNTYLLSPPPMPATRL